MRRWALTGLLVTLALVGAAAASARTPRVLRVGDWHRVAGQYRSIQQAVDAAKPGDWVLVGPGDYKTTSSRAPAGAADTPAGVLIQTPRLKLRGMDRNGAVVDGTTSGGTCNRIASDQNFGPAGTGGAQGLNGVLVWKAPDVWVQNLTVCNFLGGAGNTGNEVWWNGGDGSAVIGGYGFLGSYLNATSTFYKDEASAARYGIFSSNWNGGTWDQTYASNFNDSGYYIGACQQQCNQVVDHAWSEFSALGYSGSNSGGSLLIENSQFDNNKDGFDTNSQNGDNPPPQDGSCPAGVKPPLAGAPTCWVFANNYVHDNNNPNVPASGSAAAGPVGTGVSLSGARNDTLMNNRFVNNDAWGTVLVPYPDSGPPCTGGDPNAIPGTCLFDEWGIHVVNNTYTHNGGYGHPSNGDIAWFNFTGGHPTNCFSGNTDTGGTLTTSPDKLQQNYPTCDGHPVPANNNITFLNEALCDSQVQLVSGVPAQCPSGPYPQRTQVIMHPLPAGSQLPTMAKVCSDVPADPWCSGTVIRVRGCAARKVRIPLTTAPRERLVSTRVRIGRRKLTRRGRRSGVWVNLGRRHHRVRVRVTERIRVGSHRERFSFTRIYHRC